MQTNWCLNGCCCNLLWHSIVHLLSDFSTQSVERIWDKYISFLKYTAWNWNLYIIYIHVEKEDPVFHILLSTSEIKFYFKIWRKEICYFYGTNFLIHSLNYENIQG